MRFRCVIAFLLMTATFALAGGTTLIDRICAQYDAIKTLSCQTRKTTMAGDKGVTMLSRVYYQQPDRLNVENISPLHRRIVADGRAFYLHHAGLPRAFSRPIDKLDGDMRMMIGAIAGTPLEHLLRLRGRNETVLAPLPAFPTRCGYAAGANLFVVINCDTSGRLTQIDYFKSPTMDTRVATTVFTNFMAVSSNCWLALRHQTTISMPSNTITETRVFDEVVVNQPLDKTLFDHNRYFKDIPFVAELSAME